MNIFKTFEIFLREPLSVLKHNWIQIVSLQTDNLFKEKPSCEISLLKDGAQITVVNNEKMYNLLSLVTQKAKQKEKSEILK
ncbi:MAG: hypothetical protein MJ230_03620 [bacterium]|nr:hypothetical protein [bacterium]